MISLFLHRTLRGAARLGLGLTSASAWAGVDSTDASAPATAPAPVSEAAPVLPEAAPPKLTLGGFLRTGARAGPT